MSARVKGSGSQTPLPFSWFGLGFFSLVWIPLLALPFFVLHSTLTLSTPNETGARSKNSLGAAPVGIDLFPAVVLTLFPSELSDDLFFPTIQTRASQEGDLGVIFFTRLLFGSCTILLGFSLPPFPPPFEFITTRQAALL